MNAAPLVVPAVLAFVLVVIVQRVIELRVSARHAAALERAGASEHARGHFPLLVGVHVLLPLALLAEVLVLGARPGRAWGAWLSLWLAAQWLRYAAVHALGRRWTTGIWVLPGEPLVAAGPYRWFPHPNYLAVVIELIAGPLVFGAWRTAIGISLLNLGALAIRIRAEERALAAVRHHRGAARATPRCAETRAPPVG